MRCGVCGTTGTHYAGGKSAVHALVNQLRAWAVCQICRFDGVASGFSQHDFRELLVVWTGGGRRKVLFFVSRLKYPRYALVTGGPNTGVEMLARKLAAHSVQIGGLANPSPASIERP